MKSRLLEIEHDRMKYFCSTIQDHSITQKETISIFQISAQIQRNSKTGNLRLLDGNVITGDVGRLKQIINGYFSEQFEKAGSNNISLNLEEDPLNNVTKHLTVQQQRELVKPITIEEMYNTLKLCKKKKSPGPDGLN